MAGRFRNHFVLLFTLFFFLEACSREIPYTIVLQDGVQSSGEEAAKLAETFLPERITEDNLEIIINPDGSASVLETGLSKPNSRNPVQKEIIRVYHFGSGEFITLLPQGFYTAKFETGRTFSNAASSLLIKTKGEQFLLSQFSAFLFRPDIVEGFIRDELSADSELPWNISSLLKGKKKPPDILSAELSEGRIAVKIKTSEEGSSLVVWGSRQNETQELLAIMDIEEYSLSKTRKSKQIIYEAIVDAPSHFFGSIIGVSALNAEKNMESERLWIDGSSLQPGILMSSAVNIRPNLHVLFTGLENKPLAELFTAQEQSGFYSRVMIHYSENNADAVSKKFNELSALVNEQDIFVFFLSAESASNTFGDFVFYNSNIETLSSWELAGNFLKLKSRRTFLFLDAQDMNPLSHETAFARLGQFLGTKTAIANYAFDKENTAGEFSLPVSENRYVSASEFIALIQNNSLMEAQKIRFFPGEDFQFLDAYAGYGEIRMQTMYSGTVNISGPSSFNATSSALTFGETLTRRLPAGQYIVTMIYRNGRREIKTANLTYNSSLWVTFSYVPDLLEGSFSRLPVFGVNINELNPANYRGANTQVLRAMEVPTWQVSFLAGEEFYRNGRYSNAITEYTRSISLKNDYYASYVSRGNAYRRNGDTVRAIDDYTRALRLKPDYAEVYNYRGYLYSQRGDFTRAVGDYTQAIRYRANYVDALFNRAYAYSKLSLWDETINDYSQVIRLEPNNASAYTERGRARQNKGDNAGAEADSNRAESLKNQ